jgi:hydrogenase-4 component B
MSGFVSELLIYGGLLGGAAPSSQASALLVAIAGATGFVGAVGALAMTRAFGLAFLGTPRDPTITAAGDPPPAMQGVIVVHAGLVLALGLAPELGVALLRGALARFPVGGDAADVLAPITPLLWASRGLALALAAAGVLGWRRARAARRAATWGCGYGAPNPRMQYTASSFADGLARIFEAILPIRRRERLSPALFPARTDHLAATPVDAVEGRMFEVLGQGEELVTHASERLPEKPHLMFAAGLLALLAIGAIVAGLGGLGR